MPWLRPWPSHVWAKGMSVQPRCGQAAQLSGLPPAGDVIVFAVDSDPPFSAPLPSFAPDRTAGMPTKYRLQARDLFVEPDFAKRRLSVTGRQAMLPNFDAANDAGVVLKLGAAAAVDNVPATDHDGKRHCKFKQDAQARRAVH